MSKPKQYDREQLLITAVELFRRQGFNGTSTAELVEELGINRKSMYAEFGSKQELFEAVLDYYNSHHLQWVLAPLEADNAGIEQIRQAFYGYASAADGPYRGLGCLMCNTAVERAALDSGSAVYVDAYLQRITSAFEQVLSNAQLRSRLKESIDISVIAGFLTTALIGLAASLRAQAPASQLWACYETVSLMLSNCLVAEA